MKKLFLIISIPTITILMTLNAPTIYIFGLITIFIIAFYVADKKTQSNDIILQSKLDNPKNPTEYTMIKKSPLFTSLLSIVRLYIFVSAPIRSSDKRLAIFDSFIFIIP